MELLRLVGTAEAVEERRRACFLAAFFLVAAAAAGLPGSARSSSASAALGLGGEAVVADPAPSQPATDNEEYEEYYEDVPSWVSLM